MADLCTLANVRAQLQKAVGDDKQDGILTTLITAASAEIIRWTGREFTPIDDQTRSFWWEGMSPMFLTPYDLRAATDVTIDGSTIPTSGYRLGPLPNPHGTYQHIAFWGMRGCSRGVQVDVAGDWGMLEVPADVRQACVVTVAIWARRDIQAFTTTYNQDTERLEYPEALPSSVRAMLNNYRRPMAA